MVAVLLPYPRGPLPSLPRPLTPTMNEKAQWYALLGGAFAAIAGLVGAVWTQVYQLRAKRDEIGADTKKSELAELREFRQELREETDRLRVRLDKVEAELGEARAALVEQRGFFVNILYKLEGIMTLKDVQRIESEVRTLIENVRHFIDIMPIGVFERHNLIESKEPKNG